MVFQTGGQGFPPRRSHLSWPSMREAASPGGAKGGRVPGQGTAETKAGDLGACFCSSRLGSCRVRGSSEETFRFTGPTSDSREQLPAFSLREYGASVLPRDYVFS